MIWLQSPPWGRWLLAGLLVITALWMELRPDPLIDHPFAVMNISPGEEITTLNTDMRRVPSGLLDPPADGAVAKRPIAAGAPVLATDTGPRTSVVPSGWWVVSADVPRGAIVGDNVRIVILTSGEIVEGFVASAAEDDPFGSTSGGVAVQASVASQVAVAATNGQIAVLVSTG